MNAIYSKCKPFPYIINLNGIGRYRVLNEQVQVCLHLPRIL